jgi:hypothetical protein
MHAPEAPKAPEAPEAPEAPKAPVAPEAPEAPEAPGPRLFLLERIGEAAVVQLYADGFAKLAVRDRILCWHLYKTPYSKQYSKHIFRNSHCTVNNT